MVMFFQYAARLDAKQIHAFYHFSLFSVIYIIWLYTMFVYAHFICSFDARQKKMMERRKEPNRKMRKRIESVWNVTTFSIAFSIERFPFALGNCPWHFKRPDFFFFTFAASFVFHHVTYFSYFEYMEMCVRVCVREFLRIYTWCLPFPIKFVRTILFTLILLWAVKQLVMMMVVADVESVLFSKIFYDFLLSTNLRQLLTKWCGRIWKVCKWGKLEYCSSIYIEYRKYQIWEYFFYICDRSNWISNVISFWFFLFLRLPFLPPSSTSLSFLCLLYLNPSIHIRKCYPFTYSCTSFSFFPPYPIFILTHTECKLTRIGLQCFFSINFLFHI